MTKRKADLRKTILSHTHSYLSFFKCNSDTFKNVKMDDLIGWHFLNTSQLLFLSTHRKERKKEKK